MNKGIKVCFRLRGALPCSCVMATLSYFFLYVHCLRLFGNVTRQRRTHKQMGCSYTADIDFFLADSWTQQFAEKCARNRPFEVNQFSSSFAIACVKAHAVHEKKVSTIFLFCAIKM